MVFGDILGVIIGTFLGLPYITRIIAGVIVVFPVNYALVKKGIRHHH